MRGRFGASAVSAALALALAGCGEARPSARAVESEAADAPDEMPALVPLEIELPRPRFMMCVAQPRYPGVEAPSGPRPPLMVPAGTRNLALGKPVSSSALAPVAGETDQVTDGEKSATKGNCLVLGPGAQWVQVDVGGPCEIRAVAFWLHHDGPRVFHDVIVQVADDPDCIMGVRTLFNNDADNSSGLGVGRDREYYETYEGRLVEAKGERARYVRLYSNGSTADEMNRCTEVEVYGRPAE